jgi:FeS assembly SUF system protein
VIEVLKQVYDPEIPVNVYELGLVYGVEADEETGRVGVTMTLTTPACPVAGTLPGEVENRIRALEGVTECKVDLVWDPPWTMEKLSEEARLQLGIL